MWVGLRPQVGNQASLFIGVLRICWRCAGSSWRAVLVVGVQEQHTALAGAAAACTSQVQRSKYGDDARRLLDAAGACDCLRVLLLPAAAAVAATFFACRCCLL